LGLHAFFVFTLGDFVSVDFERRQDRFVGDDSPFGLPVAGADVELAWRDEHAQR